VPDEGGNGRAAAAAAQAQSARSNSIMAANAAVLEQQQVRGFSGACVCGGGVSEGVRGAALPRLVGLTGAGGGWWGWVRALATLPAYRVLLEECRLAGGSTLQSTPNPWKPDSVSSLGSGSRALPQRTTLLPPRLSLQAAVRSGIGRNKHGTKKEPERRQRNGRWSIGGFGGGGEEEEAGYYSSGNGSSYGRSGVDSTCLPTLSAQMRVCKGDGGRGVPGLRLGGSRLACVVCGKGWWASTCAVVSTLAPQLLLLPAYSIWPAASRACPDSSASSLPARCR